jgi:hypothetical protein
MAHESVTYLPLSFTCPRCGRAVDERLYGPCSNCRGVLRIRYAADARIIELEAYETKMNVTPNAVALRDDD